MSCYLAWIDLGGVCELGHAIASLEAGGLSLQTAA